MKVDPVQATSAGIERQTTLVPLRENTPKAEIATTQSGPVPLLIPEHEVKVQLDTPEDDIMVYQVLDKQSGALVQTVLSSQ